MVDDGEHLGTRAVVPRQREQLRRRRAPLPEDLDVGVAEAVDRLELVAHEEHLRGAMRAAEQIYELALEAIRVLELVHHDRAEAELLALPDLLVVAEQVAGAELEILEVERGLAILGLLVRAGETVQELLQQIAVGRGQFVQRRLLDPLSGLFVARRALAA